MSQRGSLKAPVLDPPSSSFISFTCTHTYTHQHADTDNVLLLTDGQDKWTAALITYTDDKNTLWQEQKQRWANTTVHFNIAHTHTHTPTHSKKTPIHPLLQWEHRVVTHSHRYHIHAYSVPGGLRACVKTSTWCVIRICVYVCACLGCLVWRKCHDPIHHMELQ